MQGRENRPGSDDRSERDDPYDRVTWAHIKATPGIYWRAFVRAGRQLSRLVLVGLIATLRLVIGFIVLIVALLLLYNIWEGIQPDPQEWCIEAPYVFPGGALECADSREEAEALRREILGGHGDWSRVVTGDVRARLTSRNTRVVRTR